MSATNMKDLQAHIGHKIVCVGYALQDLATGKRLSGYQNVALECEDCMEVLLDYDREELKKKK
jgi:hypothetical protein